MAQRGRPTKVLSSSDLSELLLFIRSLPFRKKNQEHALDLLQRTEQDFDEAEMKILKSADREKLLFQQRQGLLEQIKLKEKNQQKLFENELEILALEKNRQEREDFFRLDRALESYMKIQKAVLNDRIRLENERRRDVLKKSGKSTSEAQKRRNEENRRKYELGGAVLAAFKKLNMDIESLTPEQIQNIIINNITFVKQVKQSEIFKEVIKHQENYFKQRNLFFDVLDGLTKWSKSNKKLSTIEIEKRKSKYEE
ncbi:hypothetical protein OZX61_11965 (plasmid) [Acinetobacter sp. ESL0695]|uniref:hypothetical protein n=1 Tax=Acinetobacter sp. ESL0695 TaxID=2983215 RepID=UPI0023F29206|nr:hypothetical protein [Acinetobacter sp. ESL0695]WEV50107.1 hypothetical protein OZX61_11965 [Acinetobacter sp. ESL0695]